MKKLSLFLVLICALAFSMPANATIGVTSQTTTLYGNNSTTLWYFNFPADAASDLQVITTSSTGQQTTLTPSQYAVALNPASAGNLWSVGGSIHYPLSGSPLATGTSITITRVIPLLQTTTLSNQGDFNPQVVEQALDTSIMQTQQVSARTGQLRGTWITGASYNFGDIVVDGANGSDTLNLYVCALSNTSATWSADLTAGDWSLALNVQGIVNTLPSIANNTMLANISGGSLAPYGVTGSAYLDSVFGSTQGDILYRNASNWVVLAPGTNGQVLTSGGAAANVSWGSAGGGGVSSFSGGSTGLTPSSPTTGAVVLAGAVGIGAGGTGATTASTAISALLGSPSAGTYSLSCSGTACTPVAGNGGGLVKLATVNASAASSVVFNSTYITVTYNKYLIEFDGLYCSANNQDLYMTLSTDNGSTYLSALYGFAGVEANSGGTVVGFGSSSTSHFDMTGGTTALGNAVATAASGSVKFSNPPASAGLNVDWKVNTGGVASAYMYFSGAGEGPGTTAINNIKIAPSSGTITGHFVLYGYQP